MKSYSLTDTGRVRSMNEDYVFVSERPIGKLPNLFVVADGMGGHNAGERASSYAVEVLLANIRKSKERNPVKVLRYAMEHANDSVYQEAMTNERCRGMGTTMVAATILKDTLYITNVGDSRLYVIGNGIRQITHDHSLVEEMVRMGKLTEEEGRNHPDKNIITRAMGVKEEVEADIYEYRLKKGDMILMCTDGLSNMVEDEDMFDIVKGARDIVEAVQMLIEKANSNGGRDNIGVVLAEPLADEVSAW